MSLLNSILQESVLHGAKIEIDHGGAVVSVAGYSKRLSFDCPYPNEDLLRFHCWAVRPPSSAESGILEVRNSGADSIALGYIFPVNTFSPDSPYGANSLSGRFKKIFSSVAGIALCRDGIANVGVELRYEEISEEIPLREIFSDDLSIVVLGVENMERAGCSIGAARLLLQEYGYFVVDHGASHTLKRPRPALPGVAAKVGSVPEGLMDSCKVIEKLISLASRQVSSVSALLIYYQVIEIMSEKLLLSKLREIAAAPQQSGYAFKKKLSKIGSEQTRVSSLCHMASRNGDAESFSRLKDLGKEFIELCGLRAGKSPGKVLYGVRNIVVHSQASMDDRAHDLLSDVITELHAVVCSMVRNFDGAYVVPEDGLDDED